MADRVSVHITNLTNVKALTRAAVDNDAFWTYAASQWHRLYYDWIPMDTERLADNVTISPGVITHNEPYAAFQYYGGDGKRVIVNRSRDRHPLASSQWDEAAAPTQLPKLEASLEEYLDKKLVKG